MSKKSINPEKITASNPETEAIIESIILESKKDSENKISFLKDQKWFLPVIIAVGSILLLSLVFGGIVVYNRYWKDQKNVPKPTATFDFKSKIGGIVQIKGVSAQNFGTFNQPDLAYKPKVEAYQIEEDFANIENKDQLLTSLPDTAQNLLKENLFVVTPGYSKEFFEVYENNRYGYIPSFITTDSILHNFHLLFDYSLKKLEQEQLIQTLRELNAGMLAASESQYQSLKGTAWEKAAWRNLAFFNIATKLLEPAAPINSEVSDIVNSELNLVDQHQGIALSPLMNQDAEVQDYMEDYSQYIPRGHYTKSETLSRYFKTMMWYGRLTFRQKNEDETRSAILMSLAVGQREDNFTNWEKIYEPTNFFVGKSDDLTFYQYLEILKRVYGENVNLDKLLSADNFTIFLGQVKELKAPELNSMPIFDESTQPDREKEIKGFRFMGQRFTVDASIFQKLIYRDVKENKKGQRRMLPQALDIPAALGSEEAYNVLKTKEVDAYQNYPENMRRLQEYLKNLDQKTWTQNLYWGWLYSLSPLTLIKGEGYPSFMRNIAWQRKNLNSYLGSWTELKHDTILYAKQVYAELGAGPIDEADDKGYVEPEPEVYARLSALSGMMLEGLDLRGILSENQKTDITKMKSLADQLLAISKKELENKSLTADEYNFIRFYGGELEHLWLNAMKDEGVESASQTQEHPASLVSDVATDPNGQVLEEATGNIFNLYVIVPVEGKLRLARGGVYSHYEFIQPLDNRLTDEEWWKIVDGTSAKKLPVLPDWTQSFISAE